MRDSSLINSAVQDYLQRVRHTAACTLKAEAEERPALLEGFGPLGSWKLRRGLGKGTPKKPGRLRREREKNIPCSQPLGPLVHLTKSVTWLVPWAPG